MSCTNLKKQKQWTSSVQAEEASSKGAEANEAAPCNQEHVLEAIVDVMYYQELLPLQVPGCGFADFSKSSCRP